MALPCGTTGSLCSSFLPDRLVCLPSQAPLCPYTLRPVTNRSEGTFRSLRYAFGGDHPSQTTHHTVSSCLGVRTQTTEGPYFNVGSTNTGVPASNASGLSYTSSAQTPSRVIGIFTIFTDTTISPSSRLRQCRAYPPTWRPVQILAFASGPFLKNLTLPGKVTLVGSLCKGTPSRHYDAPTACERTGSGLFTPLLGGSFSPFPHGLLSVSRGIWPYGWARNSRKIFVPRATQDATRLQSSSYGSPPYDRFFPMFHLIPHILPRRGPTTPRVA